MSRGLFTTIYMLGISAGIALIVAVYLQKEWAIEFADKQLFFSSIGYIIFLAFIAYFFTSVPRSRVIGSKIGMAGYLYTLIGFIISIIKLNGEESFSIKMVIFPTGTALVTSLLGWFFGELLSEEDHYQISKNKHSSMDILVDTLSKFAIDVETIHERYNKAITGAASEFEAIKNKASDMDAALELLQKTLSDMKHIADTIPLVSENFKALSENAKDASEAAKDTAEYLKHPRLMVEELKHYINSINNLSNGHR